MAAPPCAVKPAKQLGPDGGEEQIHKIRITLTSKNVKNIEKVCADLVRSAKDKMLRVKGTVRIPTRFCTSPPGSPLVVKEVMKHRDAAQVAAVEAMQEASVAESLLR